MSGYEYYKVAVVKFPKNGGCCGGRHAFGYLVLYKEGHDKRVELVARYNVANEVKFSIGDEVSLSGCSPNPGETCLVSFQSFEGGPPNITDWDAVKSLNSPDCYFCDCEGL